MATQYKTVQIGQLPLDDVLSGSEIVPIQDNGKTKRTTVDAIVSKVGFTENLKQRIVDSVTQQELETKGFLTNASLTGINQEISTIRTNLDSKVETSALANYATLQNFQNLETQIQGKANASDIQNLATAQSVQELSQLVSTKIDENKAREIASEGNDAFLKHDGSVIPTQDLSMGDHKITNLKTPTTGTDAATKAYVDQKVSDAANGGASAVVEEFTKDVDASGYSLKNLKDPSDAQDASTKKYVDDTVTSKIAEIQIPDAFNGDLGNKRLQNVSEPEQATDGATKNYVDTQLQTKATTREVDQKISQAKSEIESGIDTKADARIARALASISFPNNESDAASKSYVDQKVSEVSVEFDGDMKNKKISNLAEPTLESDAARLADINAAKQTLQGRIESLEGNVDSYWKLDGSNQPTSNINLGGQSIINLKNPESAQDASTKKYVDDIKDGLSVQINSKIGSSDVEGIVNPLITNSLKNVPEPTENNHAARKADVDSLKSSLEGKLTEKVNETDLQAKVQPIVDQKAQEVSGSIDQKIATHYTTTVTPAINAAKFTGDMEDRKITNLNNPEAAQDAVNKRWAEANFLKRNNSDTMLVDLNMNSKKVINLADPSQPQEAATKAYVDSKVGQGGGSANLPQAKDKQTLMYDQGQWKAVDFTAGTINYVQSRDVGLITNGSGYLKNNYNFSAFTFDPSESYSGWGCFKITGTNSAPMFDETIPIDLNGEYEFSIAIRDCGPSNVNNPMYVFISPMDMDGLDITPAHVPFVKFRLGATLTKGQTQLTVHPDDRATFKAEWDKKKSMASNLAVFDSNYTSASGFKYPVGEYSRKQLNANVLANAVSYSESTGVLSGINFNFGEWTKIDAGEYVHVGVSGGTYIYFIHEVAGQVQPKVWKRHTVRKYMRDILRPWTAMVKVGILCNRGGQSTTAISSMSLRQVERSVINFTEEPETRRVTGNNNTLTPVQRAKANAIVDGALFAKNGTGNYVNADLHEDAVLTKANMNSIMTLYANESGSGGHASFANTNSISYKKAVYFEKSTIHKYGAYFDGTTYLRGNVEMESTRTFTNQGRLLQSGALTVTGATTFNVRPTFNSGITLNGSANYAYNFQVDNNLRMKKRAYAEDGIQYTTRRIYDDEAVQGGYLKNLVYPTTSNSNESWMTNGTAIGNWTFPKTMMFSDYAYFNSWTYFNRGAGVQSSYTSTADNNNLSKYITNETSRSFPSGTDFFVTRRVFQKLVEWSFKAFGFSLISEDFRTTSGISDAGGNNWGMGNNEAPRGRWRGIKLPDWMGGYVIAGMSGENMKVNGQLQDVRWPYAKAPTHNHDVYVVGNIFAGSPGTVLTIHPSASFVRFHAWNVDAQHRQTSFWAVVIYK